MKRQNKQFLTAFMLCCCISITAFSQKEKITGRWKPVRMIAETYPEGIDTSIAEKKLYENIKETSEKQNKEINMDAEDSASVKRTAKEVVDEAFQNIYFRFNPDNSCYFNFGKLLDETDTEGTNLKGKYRIDEETKSITVSVDKNQKVAGEETKFKKNKMVFYYSFNKEQLRLELDDGTLVFYLVTEK